MRTTTLAIAVAALGCGCSSINPPQYAFQVESVVSVRHGAPDAQAYYQLGRYFQGQNRTAEAEAAYLKALAADARNVLAMNALAALYAERGELERSAQLFQKVAEVSPDAAYLYNNLGYTYLLQGRLDAAYAEVRKALVLDPNLDRAWANLQRIADLKSDAALALAVTARRLDLIPGAATASTVAVAEGGAARDAEPKLAMAYSMSAPAVVDRVAAASVEIPAAAAPPLAVAGAAPTESGHRFMLVAATEEIEASGGTIELPRAEARAEPAKMARDDALRPARVEVSNGNGVARCARNFGSRLRSEKIVVTRITNNRTYHLQRTVIEYRPGYRLAAEAFARRIGLAAQVVEAASPRLGTDVRIVLGRDATHIG